MKRNILSFLFLESTQGEDRLDIAENLERLFEAAEESVTTALESKKTPLAKALGDLGIDNADLQLDPEGFCMITDDQDYFSNALNVLGTPDAMHKLAQMGWVVTKQGDVAMTGEPAEFRIRFLEITTVEASDGDKASEKANEIAKKAREFASTPMDRDDSNPVETEDGKMGKGQEGVGKVKDGAEAEKSIHEGYEQSSREIEGWKNRTIADAESRAERIRQHSPDESKALTSVAGRLRATDFSQMTEVERLRGEIQVLASKHTGHAAYFQHLASALRQVENMIEESATAMHESLIMDEVNELLEMTGTGSMGTVTGGPQGVIGSGIAEKPTPYKKGTSAKKWGTKMWSVNPPIIKKPKA
jgi:hypothetical protein